MHSRIFQIERKPIPMDERLDAITVPEWFTNSVADYVADVGITDRVSSIEWLMAGPFGQVCKREGDKITFNIDVGSFFDASFEKFTQALEKLTKINFQQFVNDRKSTNGEDLSYLMFLLNEAYNDKHGFYIWNDDKLYTLQSWMRKAKPLSEYYFGGVVDYHF